MITEFPLFLFTLLGGTAAGTYVFAWAFPVREDKKHWLMSFVALVLLAISGIALLTHLGHPERMFNAFSNPNAGITREAFATGLFGVLVLAEFIVALKTNKPAPKGLRAVAAIAGLLLLVAMGAAYVVFHGVPAWANWATVPLFVVGGLSAGICALPLFDAGLEHNVAHNSVFATIAALLNVLFACTCAAVGMHFMSVGFSVLPFACAAVIAVAAAVVAYLAKARTSTAYPRVAFLLAFVAVIVARYAFYMAF